GRDPRPREPLEQRLRPRAREPRAHADGGGAARHDARLRRGARARHRGAPARDRDRAGADRAREVRRDLPLRRADDGRELRLPAHRGAAGRRRHGAPRGNLRGPRAPRDGARLDRPRLLGLRLEPARRGGRGLGRGLPRLGLRLGEPLRERARRRSPRRDRAAPALRRLLRGRDLARGPRLLRRRSARRAGAGAARVGPAPGRAVTRALALAALLALAFGLGSFYTTGALGAFGAANLAVGSAALLGAVASGARRLGRAASPRARRVLARALARVAAALALAVGLERGAARADLHFDWTFERR